MNVTQQHKLKTCGHIIIEISRPQALDVWLFRFQRQQQFQPMHCSMRQKWIVGGCMTSLTSYTLVLLHKILVLEKHSQFPNLSSCRLLGT